MHICVNILACISKKSCHPLSRQLESYPLGLHIPGDTQSRAEFTLEKKDPGGRTAENLKASSGHLGKEFWGPRYLETGNGAPHGHTYLFGLADSSSYKLCEARGRS